MEKSHHIRGCLVWDEGGLVGDAFGGRTIWCLWLLRLDLNDRSSALLTNHRGHVSEVSWQAWDIVNIPCRHPYSPPRTGRDNSRCVWGRHWRFQFWNISWGSSNITILYNYCISRIQIK
jgi:hypothetical protein